MNILQRGVIWSSLLYGIPVAILCFTGMLFDVLFVLLVSTINLLYHLSYEKRRITLDVVFANILVAYNFLLLFYYGRNTSTGLLALYFCGFAVIVFIRTNQNNYDEMHTLRHILTIIGMSILYSGI